MERNLFIWILFVACMGLSFLFSGMESGVLALSRLRIRQMMRSGNASARALLHYLDAPENFLWTILVGNTLANFVVVGFVVMALRKWLHGWHTIMVIAFLALMFLFYTFCELLPKMLFRTYPNRLTLAVARPFRFIHFVLSPLVWMMTKLSRGLVQWTDGRTFTGHLFGSREEMRLFMQESSQGLTSEERQMINHVLDLQHTVVRDIAIPINQAATVTMHTPMNEALNLARERRFSRLPVWRGEGTQRRIAGIVSLRTVLYQPVLDSKKTAGDYVKPALYLEEDMRLEAALKRMQRGGQRLAIVLARDRREIGIVSLQDILKVIFGEVRL